MVLSAVTLAAVATPASADPAPGTEFRILAGVGSDTTQDVLNGLADVITDAADLDGDGDTAEKVIASWDAQPSNTTIRTKATGCEIARPNGSGAGRTAVREAANPNSATAGCVDFARSSSGPVSGGDTGTWVRFGKDAVTYAYNGGSDLPDTLTLVQLQRIYQCLTTDILGVPVTPLIPQRGSGTRSFWLSQMNITENDLSNGDYPCVTDLGNTVQEHNGGVLTDNVEYIVPFSIAQYIAQGNNLPGVADRRGQAVLGSVRDAATDTTYAPVVDGKLNLGFPYSRDVYNLVPTAKVADPAIAATFIGATSSVCSNGTTITQFGFGFDPATCGTTATGLL